MNSSRFIVVLVAALISWLSPAFGQVSLNQTPQQVFHTQKADIVYEYRSDLEELARRLGTIGPGLPPQADFGRLAEKIDGMLSEISRVLQKWPARPVKLTIRLLRDGFQVQHQQLALRAVPPHRVAPGPGALESYYEPRVRTIFLSVADARSGILAHEMTHFILCESPGARTSEAYQESLARYMEDRFNTGR